MHAVKKENTCTKVSHWPFVKGVHMWRVDIPDKVSVMRKARDFYIRCPYKIPGKTFPYLDVIMQGHGGAIIYLYILLYQYMYLWSLSIICIYLYLFLDLHLYPLQYLTRQCFPFVLITGVFNTAEAEFGSLSILINNAGLGVFRPPQQTYDVNVVSERDLVWWQEVDTNVGANAKASSTFKRKPYYNWANKSTRSYLLCFSNSTGIAYATGPPFFGLCVN